MGWWCYESPVNNEKNLPNLKLVQNFFHQPYSLVAPDGYFPGWENSKMQTLMEGRSLGRLVT